MTLNSALERRRSPRHRLLCNDNIFVSDWRAADGDKDG